MNTEQESGVQKLLGNLPGEYLAEPAERYIVAAIALGTGWVAVRDHTAIMVVLPADHVIANGAAFQETLAFAADEAEETSELVTIGIEPTWACPGFGYIEHGKSAFAQAPDKKRFIMSCAFVKSNPDLAEPFYAEEISDGTRECSSGPCLRCFANLTVTRRSWLISFHICALLEISIKHCVSASANCRVSRSITRSWRKRIAFSSWRPALIGTTSEAGRRLRIILKRTN